MNIYLALDNTTALKASLFTQLVQFLQNVNQLQEVMIQQVRDIAELSADWYLNDQQRINLYIQCAQALTKENDDGNAFKVYFQAFKIIAQ